MTCHEHSRMNENLCSGIFGKTRQAVLALLFGRADTSFYTKQILDTVKIGRGTVQRELKNLTDNGIIIREVQGRQVYYHANEKCPIFIELYSIMKKKTAARLMAVKETQAIYSSPPGAANSRISVPRGDIAAFCRRHHINRLSLFGSVLREDFRPDSDVDVLVEFEPGYVPGLFKLSDMALELSALFVGHRVDLRTPSELSRYFRDRIMREASVQYATTR
jgi:predicted nucleotidyltransferase/predicted transcriptional regulator